MNCGCQFKDDKIDYDLDKLNLKCPLIWDLISSGKTIGLFQIDSGLGQMLSKKLKPENIHHVAALIAIMRPSCLKGTLDDGKSITNHFIDRKNGLEEPICPYSALKDILKDTYGLLIFQEQSIKIGQEIAGLTLQESDKYIRYGIGKKKAEIIAEAEKVFLAGCKKVEKVTEKEAQEIFEWLRSAQRYQFNASHSYEYAVTTIATAIAKAHFPLRFFKSYLNHSTDKMKPLDEVKNLVGDARNFNIIVNNPDLRLNNPKFIIKDGQIYFGLQYIKGVGDSGVRTLTKLIDAISQNNRLEDISWIKLLLETLLCLNKTIVKNIIAVGALDYLKISRERLLFEHDVALKLTKKEVEWIVKNIDLQQYSQIEKILDSILNLPIGKGNAISNKNRKNIIKGLYLTIVKTPFSVIDSISRICALESSYLGIPLKYHKTDELDKNLSDTSCKEIKDGKLGKVNLIVEILKVKEIINKRGEKQAFLTLEDSTSILDGTIFSEALNKCKDELFEGNSILLNGYVGKKGLILNNCKSI